MLKADAGPLSLSASQGLLLSARAPIGVPAHEPGQLNSTIAGNRPSMGLFRMTHGRRSLRTNRVGPLKVGTRFGKLRFGRLVAISGHKGFPLLPRAIIPKSGSSVNGKLIGTARFTHTISISAASRAVRKRGGDLFRANTFPGHVGTAARPNQQTRRRVRRDA